MGDYRVLTAVAMHVVLHSDCCILMDCIYFFQAIDIFTDMGRFTMAAKHHVNIAELYESESMDIPKAIEHYEKVRN